MADQLWELLHSRPELEAQRRLLVELSHRYRPFADRNFETELRYDFGARFWEMFLGIALLEGGFPVVPQADRDPAGPDICFLLQGRRVWVEAIAPKAGQGPDAVPGLQPGGGWIPESQIVLRYRAAVEEKHRKRQGYLSNGVVQADEAYIVALNGFQIPSGHNAFPDEVPYPVRSVLPLGALTVMLDRESGDIVDQGSQTRFHILKKSGSEVRTDVFLDETYAGISGLLFSAAHPLDVGAPTVSSLAYLHNPQATGQTAMPRGWLGGGIEWSLEGNELLRQAIQAGA